MNPTTVKFKPLVLDNPDIKAVHVIITGAIDESNVDELSKEIITNISKNPDNTSYIADLKELEFINSKGIGYLFTFYKNIQNKGGLLILTNMPANIVDIFNIVGVTRVIKSFFTLEEAKDFLLKTQQKKT